MSDLSVFLNKVEAVVEEGFHDLETLVPAAGPSISTAKASASAAVSAVIEAAPTIANTGVNALLGMVPEGALFAPAVDAVIDEAIALLTAKKTAAPARAATPGAVG